MHDKNVNVNIHKLKIIANKWKEANTPGSRIDLNKLADFTIKIVNSEPLIKEICDAYLFSLSIRAIKDPDFDKDTYDNNDKNLETTHV